MNSVERVRAICKERKIPLHRLERDCGFGNGYISQLKKGVFPDDRLYIIASYLNVSPYYLLFGEENFPEVLNGYSTLAESIPTYNTIPATLSDGSEEQYSDFIEVVNQLDLKNIESLKEYALFLLHQQQSQDSP